MKLHRWNKILQSIVAYGSDTILTRSALNLLTSQNVSCDSKLAVAELPSPSRCAESLSCAGDVEVHGDYNRLKLVEQVKSCSSEITPYLTPTYTGTHSNHAGILLLMFK